jgi:RNA polymerase sigma-70 factor (ECF subfamily)
MTDEAAFAELYRTHYPRVRGLCRHLLGSTPRGEDAAQEAFLRAYRTFASYDREQPFEAWITSIARHHCLDLLRRRRTEGAIFGVEAEEVAATIAAAEADQLGTLLSAERAVAVNAAVAALPERYRWPLALAYYGDASYDEIAQELGITRTHVGVLLTRAKQLLRKHLAEET